MLLLWHDGSQGEHASCLSNCDTSRELREHAIQAAIFGCEDNTCLEEISTSASSAVTLWYHLHISLRHHIYT